MALTVAIEVDHLHSACSYTSPHVSNHSRVLLIPNVDPKGCVRSTLKKFIRDNLSVPEELQRISAPRFTLLPDQLGVEDVYNRYCCQCEAERSDLHVDEESFRFFGRESGQQMELLDDDSLEERHIIDECKLHLKILPKKLHECGGRVYVEMRKGIVPIQGVSPRTMVYEIKKQLEAMFGIPASQQLLSCVGRIMHDEFHMEDFDGLHTVYEDSVLDLCKSGDTNLDQSHRRMAVRVTIKDDSEFTLVVQGRNSVRSVMQMIESRTGYAQRQQRLSFSGKPLDEKRMLSDYFIFPDCTLDVNILKNPKVVRRNTYSDQQEQEQEQSDEERKPLARKLKFVRTLKGRVMGTLTIPVLTTDTILDVRKKIKRSLQPLVERHHSMNTTIREPKHIDITPRNNTVSNLKSTCQASKSPSQFVESQNKSNAQTNIQLNGSSITAEITAKKYMAGLMRQVSSPIMNASSTSAQKAQPGTFSTLSARRLDLVKSEKGYTRSDECDENVRIDRDKSEKRGLGAWLNNSVQTLTEQIRFQLADI